MSDKKIILPELRFQGSEESDMILNVEFNQDSRDIIEGDRTVILSQSEQYDIERQKSNKYRLTGIIRPIWRNYTDVTTTNLEILQEMFFNDKHIDDIINLTNANTPSDVPLTSVRGQISSDEIDFVRKDFIGSNDPNSYSWYNQGNGFGPVIANKINWNLYLTYPFLKTTEDNITVNLQPGNGTISFNLSDGLPFSVTDRVTYYELYCPFNHGLTEDSFVSIDGNVYSVDFIGNKKYRSEENYFSIYKGQFDYVLTNGTFKRVVEKNNPTESTSEYFILQHKILRTPEDFEIHKNAFESSIYEDKKQIQKYSVNAQNGVLEFNTDGRIVTKENGDTYMYILQDEIDISELKDHYGRPITELYLSIIYKNNMQFFNRQKYGYENQYGLGNEDILLKEFGQLYDNPIGIVTKNFSVGDLINGGIIEYNQYDMTERVVSDMFSRLEYNTDYFTVFGPNYYYKVHQNIKLKQYSDYIEESSTNDIYNLPSYAKYFEVESLWKWRDIWSNGYINPDGLGVDYPFINGCHYINNIVNFYLRPDTIDGITNDRVKDNRINPFIIDNCE